MQTQTATSLNTTKSMWALVNTNWELDESIKMIVVKFYLQN